MFCIFFSEFFTMFIYLLFFFSQFLNIINLLLNSIVPTANDPADENNNYALKFNGFDFFCHFFHCQLTSQF